MPRRSSSRQELCNTYSDWCNLSHLLEKPEELREVLALEAERSALPSEPPPAAIAESDALLYEVRLEQVR